MSPFEVLYGTKCRTLVTWDDPMDRLMIGLDLLKDLENLVNKVKQNLKEAQDRYKNYFAQFRRDKEYKVGDHVHLKVKEKIITLILGKFGNLTSRYSRPFEILTKIGPIAYQLALPTHIKFHDVFCVSLLNKYVYHIKHIVDWNLLQVEL